MPLKTTVTDECVIHVQPPLAGQLTGRGAHPMHCTRTLYDDNGKLLDDGIVKDNERSYWEHFIDPKQARELERRLAMVESEDYVPGAVEFISMEDLESDEEEEAY